jgi:hypothetical protein
MQLDLYVCDVRGRRKAIEDVRWVAMSMVGSSASGKIEGNWLWLANASYWEILSPVRMLHKAKSGMGGKGTMNPVATVRAAGPNVRLVELMLQRNTEKSVVRCLHPEKLVVWCLHQHQGVTRLQLGWLLVFLYFRTRACTFSQLPAFLIMATYIALTHPLQSNNMTTHPLIHGKQCCIETQSHLLIMVNCRICSSLPYAKHRNDYYFIFLNRSLGTVYSLSDTFSISSTSSLEQQPLGTSNKPTVTISGGPDPTKGFAATFAPNGAGGSRIGHGAIILGVTIAVMVGTILSL